MSLIAWLDYSETERRRMMDIIDLFREKGTVDELGLGTIRDALADRLFPGTSTVAPDASPAAITSGVIAGMSLSQS